jgi:hypothetical protein
MRLNVIQRVIIFVWAIAIVAVVAYPPWTVRHSSKYSNVKPIASGYDKTELRWLLSPTKWSELGTGTKGDYEKPAIELYSARLRYDLLARELFIVSIVAAGGLLIVRSR